MSITQQWHPFGANETPVIKQMHTKAGPETSQDQVASPHMNCHLRGEPSIFDDLNGVSGDNNQAS